MRGFIFLGIFLASLMSEAYPARVILFRHAEKPLSGIHLSAKGKLRAKKLAQFLTKDSVATAKGEPDFIFAAGQRDPDSSVRSIETVQPLADKLSLDINDDFLKNEIVDLQTHLARNGKYNNKVIVISWQHEWLPLLAHELGASDAPEEWDDEDFDTLWIMDFKNSRYIYNFQIIKPRLLQQ